MLVISQASRLMRVEPGFIGFRVEGLGLRVQGLGFRV